MFYSRTTTSRHPTCLLQPKLWALLTLSCSGTALAQLPSDRMNGAQANVAANVAANVVVASSNPSTQTVATARLAVQTDVTSSALRTSDTPDAASANKQATHELVSTELISTDQVSTDQASRAQVSGEQTSAERTSAEQTSAEQALNEKTQTEALPLDGWAQFERAQQTLEQLQFDVSFVQAKGQQLATYRWLHGVYQPSPDVAPIELEQLTPQDGAGVESFRKNNRVYYSSAGQALQVTQNSHIKELPAILFSDIAVIQQLYAAVPGSSTSLSGRSAQLLRLAALDPQRYSYWLWQDAQTGFPLRLDTVDSNNRVLERWQVVHLQIKPHLLADLEPLAVAQLPQLPIAPLTDSPAQIRSQLGYIPAGFRQIAMPSAVQASSGPVLASWLLSDGPHQISIFVQPRQTGSVPQAYLDGATVLLMLPKNNVDITVIGPIAPALAQDIAQGVQIASE
jgi:negative regulator of sigma E activity